MYGSFDKVSENLVSSAPGVTGNDRLFVNPDDVGVVPAVQGDAVDEVIIDIVAAAGIRRTSQTRGVEQRGAACIQFRDERPVDFSLRCAGRDRKVELVARPGDISVSGCVHGDSGGPVVADLVQAPAAAAAAARRVAPEVSQIDELSAGVQFAGEPCLAQTEQRARCMAGLLESAGRNRQRGGIRLAREVGVSGRVRRDGVHRIPEQVEARAEVRRKHQDAVRIQFGDEASADLPLQRIDEREVGRTGRPRNPRVPGRVHRDRARFVGPLAAERGGVNDVAARIQLDHLHVLRRRKPRQGELGERTVHDGVGVAGSVESDFAQDEMVRIAEIRGPAHAGIRRKGGGARSNEENSGQTGQRCPGHAGYSSTADCEAERTGGADHAARTAEEILTGPSWPGT